MAHPVPNFLLGRRYILCGALAALAIPTTATPSLAGVKPDMAKGAMERFKLARTPKPLPDLEIQDADDKPLKLADLKGKVLLLNFWATWCAPCVKGLPELKGAYSKYHSQGLEVVGISLDEDNKALTSFIAKNQMLWPQIFDGKGWKSKVPNDYGVQAIPFLLLIGRDGKIAAVNPRGKLEEAVKAALAGG